MTADSPDKPISLSDDEASYHRSLVRQVKEAHEAQAKITRVEGAWNNWTDYLRGKYGFRDGDAMTEEGMILYAESPSDAAATRAS